MDGVAPCSYHTCLLPPARLPVYLAAILLHGRDDLSADSQPVLRAVDLADLVGAAPAELTAASSKLSAGSGPGRAGSREVGLGRTSAGLAGTSVNRAFSLVV